MSVETETVDRHSVIFVLISDGAIELEERDKSKRYSGYIFVPGGGVENGEKPTTALFREVFEEYGVVINKVRKIGTILHNDDGIRACGHVFRVISWAGVLSNPEGRSRHLQATIEQARQLCKHPRSLEILNLIEADLSQNG